MATWQGVAAKPVKVKSAEIPDKTYGKPSPALHAAGKGPVAWVREFAAYVVARVQLGYPKRTKKGVQMQVTCPSCGGSGTHPKGGTCQVCGGSGTVEKASKEEKKDLGRKQPKKK